MSRLLLFDIDGTLLSADGVGGRAFLDALEEVFGTRAAPEGFSFAGKTDPQIAHELLGAAGWEAADIDRDLHEMWPIYLRNLEERIRKVEVDPLPGIPPLLDALERSGEQVLLGLLTGNIAPGARIKLEAAGIPFGRFRVGAFGSDHRERPELPAVAVRRAEERTGMRFHGKEVVVIGDTPYDIRCGERLGVRTVAVATGSYGREELAACGPDHLFDTLEDLDAVRDALFGP